MSDATLLKSQKNEVLLLIKASEFNPSDFEFKSSRSPGLFVLLAHTPSKYWFRFEQKKVQYSPGKETHDEEYGVISWEHKMEKLGKWLGHLKREVDAPDLWASLARSEDLLVAELAKATNTPFSADEQAQIKRAIDEIRTYIRSTYSIDEEHVAQVNSKLDYLIDASTR